MTPEVRPALLRKLGVFDSTMMMMGIVIGSGIFTTTGIMAQYVPSPPLLLGVWLLGGLITLAGAFAFAELGTAMPEAGGHYVYLREAYGPLAGFLFGWMAFWVSMTGSIAALGVAFAEYFSFLFPSLGTDVELLSVPVPLGPASFVYSLSAGQIVAIVVVLVLSAINCIGVGLGARIANALTAVKIGTLLALAGLAFTVGSGGSIDMTPNPTGMSLSEIVVGIGLAMIAASWAFDGWNNINYVAGEIKDPARALPVALVLGVSAITFLYIVTNLVYLYALPIGEMTGVVRIAEAAASALFGGQMATVISLAVMVSVFGALHGTILVGPRIYYAMARDGLFFEGVARVHERYRTPIAAISLQAVWATLLTLSGTFEQLFTFVMFSQLIFWVATVWSVFTLRRTRPELARPYKTFGYPWTPSLFIVLTVGILLNTLVERPAESIAGLALTAIGIPAYYHWRRREPEPPTEPGGSSETPAEQSEA